MGISAYPWEFSEIRGDFAYPWEFFRTDFRVSVGVFANPWGFCENISENWASTIEKFFEKFFYSKSRFSGETPTDFRKSVLDSGNPWGNFWRDPWGNFVRKLLKPPSLLILGVVLHLPENEEFFEKFFYSKLPKFMLLHVVHVMQIRGDF